MGQIHTCLTGVRTLTNTTVSLLSKSLPEVRKLLRSPEPSITVGFVHNIETDKGALLQKLTDGSGTADDICSYLKIDMNTWLAVCYSAGLVSNMVTAILVGLLSCKCIGCASSFDEKCGYVVCRSTSCRVKHGLSGSWRSMTRKQVHLAMMHQAYKWLDKPLHDMVDGYTMETQQQEAGRALLAVLYKYEGLRPNTQMLMTYQQVLCQRYDISYLSIDQMQPGPFREFVYAVMLVMQLIWNRNKQPRERHMLMSRQEFLYVQQELTEMANSNIVCVTPNSFTGGQELSSNSGGSSFNGVQEFSSNSEYGTTFSNYSGVQSNPNSSMSSDLSMAGEAQVRPIDAQHMAVSAVATQTRIPTNFDSSEDEEYSAALEYVLRCMV